MKTVAIIPARGGSKGIPRKNLINFAGEPLIGWSILQARESKSVSEVYVSSDDEEILSVSEQYGAKCILRPAELSTDTSSSEEALLHACHEIQKNGETIDLVVFLQATSPLREASDIDMAVEKLVVDEADSLFSMSELDDFCVWDNEGPGLRSVTYDYRNRQTRQERAKMYLENGSIYVFRPEVLVERNNRLGGKISMYEMPMWKSHEIDTMEDLKLCEYYFQRSFSISPLSSLAVKEGM